MLAAIGIPLLLLLLAALAGTALQHRIVFSFEPLMPSMSKISPVAGLGRLLSKEALANFFKGLTKLLLFGTVITALLWPERHKIAGLIGAISLRESP